MDTSKIILIAVIAVVVMMIAGVYNRLVKLRNRFKNAFAQIDVQLKRRYDLIPNLVEIAKGYMKHERDTLEAVINARNQAVSANKQAASNPGDAASMQGLIGAETALGGAMTRFFALAEAYPDLKANQNMAARETFPTVIFAGILGFSEAQLFEVSSEQEREAPKVSFE